MTTFVIVVHVLVSILLILTVLLQPGNKGGMGAAFGGAGGATVFGGRGANTFLAKLTAGAAVVFMLTSFTLVYLSSKGGSAFDRAGIVSTVPVDESAKDSDATAEGTATKPASEPATEPTSAPAGAGDEKASGEQAATDQPATAQPATEQAATEQPAIE